MKKLILSIFMISSLFALESIHWIKNYKKAFEIAKKEHKLIYVDISLHHCPPCLYLKNIVYNYPPVIKYINKHFIPLFYWADTERVPFIFSQYFTGAAPNVLLIMPNDKLYYRILGSRPPKIFLQTLKNIDNKYQKGS